jgi:hypothetical protein
MAFSCGVRKQCSNFYAADASPTLRAAAVPTSVALTIY